MPSRKEVDRERLLYLSERYFNPDRKEEEHTYVEAYKRDSGAGILFHPYRLDELRLNNTINWLIRASGKPLLAIRLIEWPIFFFGLAVALIIRLGLVTSYLIKRLRNKLLRNR